MGRNRVHMALATYGFLSERPARESHQAEQQHALLEVIRILYPANIHGYCIDWVRPRAAGISQAVPDRVETAKLRTRSKGVHAVLENKSRPAEVNVQAGIETRSRWLLHQHQSQPRTKLGTPASLRAGIETWYPSRSGLARSITVKHHSEKHHCDARDRDSCRDDLRNPVVHLTGNSGPSALWWGPNLQVSRKLSHSRRRSPRPPDLPAIPNTLYEFQHWRDTSSQSSIGR